MNGTDHPAQSICLIDGPNVTGVLTTGVLERPPKRYELPRWNRFRDVVQAWYGVQRPCYVFNGDQFGDSKFAFRGFLRSAGFETRAPRNDGVCDADPVDPYIIARIEAAVPRFKEGTLSHMVLCSHDHGYAPALDLVLEVGGGVAVFGFREEMAPALRALEARGAAIIDLEYDAEVFDLPLNRVYHPKRRAFRFDGRYETRVPSMNQVRIEDLS